MNEKTNKRVVNNYLNHQLQRQLIKLFLWQWSLLILGTGFLGILLQFSSNPFADASENLSNFGQSFGPLFVLLLCMMPIFVRDFVQFSNRIIGPVSRTQSVLQKIANGEIDLDVRLRENDFCRDIADDLNEVLAVLRVARDERNKDVTQSDKLIEVV